MFNLIKDNMSIFHVDNDDLKIIPPNLKENPANLMHNQESIPKKVNEVIVNANFRQVIMRRTLYC